MSMSFNDQLNFLSELLMDENSSTDDAFPLARRKKAINRGEVQFAVDSKSLKNYATGTIVGDELDLPSDWVETYVLVIDNKVVSTKREMALNNWGRKYQGGEDDNVFYQWTFSGTKTMKFMSTASFTGKTYYLWYFIKPTTELADDTDESIMPDEFRESSVYWAAHRMFQQVGKTELSNRMLEQYTFYVNKAILQTDKEYVKYQPAAPDLGDLSGYESTTDRQGQGQLG